MNHITSTTCGLNCWHATEDVCHCSCGGANHGCLRRADGVQPVRTRKIDGLMHELRGVGLVEAEAQAINAAAGIKYKYAHTARQNFGEPQPRARVRPATKSEIERWPELTAYRDLQATQKPWERRSVDLLWVRVPSSPEPSAPVLDDSVRSGEVFQLVPPSAGKPIPAQFTNNTRLDGSKMPQKVLFAASKSCLSGQRDLFGE